jgi:hypothetical protein
MFEFIDINRFPKQLTVDSINFDKEKNPTDMDDTISPPAAIDYSEILTTSRVFNRNESTDYFHEALKTKGGGARFLVAKSFYGGTRNPESLLDEDVKILLHMALLVHSLSTRRQNKLLGAFLTLLFDKIEKNQCDMNEELKRITKHSKKMVEDHAMSFCSKCNYRVSKHVDFSFWEIKKPNPLPPVPTSYKKIRYTIMYGSKAFLPMLPHPMVTKLGRHAYVLPSECIRHFLTTGVMPMLFEQNSYPNQYQHEKHTPRGVEIAQLLRNAIGKGDNNHSMPLSFIEWKDDCEVSKSNKASKSGSMWIFTIMIFLSIKGPDSPRATFPIAIEPKADSHDAVEKIIGEDFKFMSMNKIPAVMNIREGGEFKWKKISFSATMYLSLGDQPEQRSGNYLLGGNSKSHGRWQYACNHSLLHKQIPACNACMSAMRQADINSEDAAWMVRDCSDCINWFSCKITDDRTVYHPKNGFPKGMALGGEVNE